MTDTNDTTKYTVKVTDTAGVETTYTDCTLPVVGETYLTFTGKKGDDQPIEHNINHASIKSWTKVAQP